MGAITHPKRPLSKGDWNNFQPRLGLAWSFRPKLQLGLAKNLDHP
jgi:hypothetical protein